MSLKKRKTPIDQLWPEREALRVKPIKKTIKQKQNENNSTQNRK